MKIFKKLFLFLSLTFVAPSHFLCAAQEAITSNATSSWSSTIMLAAAAIAATSAGVRYWWVNGNAGCIAKAEDLVEQPKWAHNFKQADNLQENAQKLMIHLTEDWNGLKGLSSGKEAQKPLPKNLEELMKVLDEHVRIFDARIREIEKNVADTELSTPGKTLAERRQRVEDLLKEENQKRPIFSWLKNWAYSWMTKPNKKRALECLEKMYAAFVKAEELVKAVKQERRRIYETYSSYAQTVTLLGNIKETEATVATLSAEQVEARKGIWHTELTNIEKNLKENKILEDLLIEKIKGTHQNIDLKKEFVKAVPNVKDRVIDLLTAIQRRIIDIEKGLVRPVLTSQSFMPSGRSRIRDGTERKRQGFSEDNLDECSSDEEKDEEHLV